MRLFSKVWKIKFSNIHLMAILVNGLSRYHSDFSIAIVDSVVEEIKVGLEQNNFRHNQKRIAVVKFLGELYNYRMVDSPLIFSTLEALVSTGHGTLPDYFAEPLRSFLRGHGVFTVQYYVMTCA